MRKLISIIGIVAMMTCLISACAETGKSDYGSNSEMSTPSSEPTEASTENTEPVSCYQPGEWTTTKYTSEWLNMFVDVSGTMKTTVDYIELTKEFDALRRKNDPNSSVTEMEFHDVFEKYKAPQSPLYLVVQPLTNPYLTVEQCANAQERTIQDTYDKWGVERKILAQKEKKIIFLGAEWLVRYTKDIHDGMTYENCTLYRIKDNCLVILCYEHTVTFFNFDYALRYFSALDGNDQQSICSQCGADVPFVTISSDTTICNYCDYDRSE